MKKIGFEPMTETIPIDLQSIALNHSAIPSKIQTLYYLTRQHRT